jgi:FtsP/CotA-like multicopper oxidase with cupredoxin domain
MRLRFLVLPAVLISGALLPVARASSPSLTNPPSISSENGVLSGTLTVAPGEVILRGKRVQTTLYNGAFVPPILRVQPGDDVRLRLVNGSNESTNIHYHGFTVSPGEGGDDPFLEVRPGTAFEYGFPIPPDHMVGLYWYHPHLHLMVNRQIAGGLSGGIILGDILAPFPELRGITERVMLLKDLKIRHGVVVLGPDPAGRTLRTINGLLKPQIDIAPASCSSGGSRTSARTSSTG